MVFSTSGIGNLVIDVGIVIVILVVLKMLKIPIVVDPFGEKSVHLRNEQSKDKDRMAPHYFGVGAKIGKLGFRSN